MLLTFQQLPEELGMQLCDHHLQTEIIESPLIQQGYQPNQLATITV